MMDVFFYKAKAPLSMRGYRVLLFYGRKIKEILLDNGKNRQTVVSHMARNRHGKRTNVLRGEVQRCYNQNKGNRQKECTTISDTSVDAFVSMFILPVARESYRRRGNIHEKEFV